jgi:hypothetical protein
MQKIIHVIYPLPINPEHTYAFQLCEMQKKQQLHPLIHTLATHKNPGKTQIQGVPIIRHRYIHPYLRLFTSNNNNTPGDPISVCLLKNLKKETQVQIYHAHAVGHISGITLTAAQYNQRPYIISLYTPTFDEPLISGQNAKNTYLNWGKYFDKKWNTHRSLQASSAILCHTKATYEKAKTLIQHDQIIYIDETAPLKEQTDAIQAIYENAT